MRDHYFLDPCELIERRGQRLEDEYWDGKNWLCCVCMKPIPEGREVECSADPASTMMCPRCAVELLPERLE
jgi:hypothetical protein